MVAIEEKSNEGRLEMIEVLKQHETHGCIYTNYTKDGNEYWHCYFKMKDHPVNKKYWKMSGQPIDE